jgi:hypothetical protein
VETEVGILSSAQNMSQSLAALGTGPPMFTALQLADPTVVNVEGAAAATRA